MSTHYPSFGRTSSGFGSVIKSLTKSLKSSSNQVPVSINPTIVGGGDEFQKLIDQLQTGSVSSRGIVAAKVADCLDKYSISSIPEIWYLAKDLCLITHPTTVRQSGLTLLIKCIHHSSPAISDKLMYFNDILHYCQLKPNTKIDPLYNLFLQALNELIDFGNDIHDFCIYDEDKNLDSFIISSISLFNTNFLETNDALYFDNLLATFKFFENCMKYNFNSLDASLIVSVVNLIIEIGEKTMKIDIIEAILSLLNTLVIFGEIPSHCHRKTIEYFSWIYGLALNDNLNLLIWESIKNLITDTRSHFLIATLCEIIANPELRRFRNTSINKMGLSTIPINASIGALQIILKIQIVNAAEDNDIDCFQDSLLQSIKNCLLLNIPIVNTSFLRSFDRLFSKDNYLQNFNISLQELFVKIMPFQLWYSTFSMFEVLKSFKVNTEQDTNYLQSICNELQYLYENHELDAPKDRLILFYMHFHQYLSSDNIKFVLKYHSEERLCTVLNSLWKNDTLNLLNYFYYKTHDTQVQIECLRVITEALKISISVSLKQSVDYDLIIDVLRKSNCQKELLVVEYLIDNIFTYIALQGPVDVYKQCCALFIQDLQDSSELKVSEKPKRFTSLDSFATTESKTVATSGTQFSVLFLDKFAKALARIFLLTLNTDSMKAKQTYEVMIVFYEYALISKNIDTLLTLSKCLIRIRTTTENYIYLTEPSDMTGLAGTFKRNVDDPEYVIHDTDKWAYPETLQYLPARYFNKPTKNLLLYYPNEKLEIEDGNKQTITLTKWFKYVVTIMEQFIDWELYSFIWAHFCSQLSNMQLFNYDQDLIIKLKSIICDQLTINLPSSVEIPKGITKADLQVALIRTMSAFVGYHNNFSRQDEDQLIKALIFGLDWWERTAIPCLNILTICCYEMPISMQKFVPVILTKLQTRVTSAVASTHTLEFFISLVQVPLLISNFTLDDFKRVFGIAFKYIQLTNDMKSRKQDVTTKSESIILQQYGVDAEVDQTPSTQLNDFTPVLTQYVFTFSYRVISNWFLNMSMVDRKNISSYLLKNLIASTKIENQLDEHTIGYLDFIIRFTYCDLPLTFSTTTDKYRDHEFKMNRWIIGNIIVSMETNTYTGESKWTITRATGITKLLVNLEGGDAIIVDKEPQQVINSNFYLLQLFESISKSQNKPIPIIEDSVIGRAFSVLDRIPPMEFHKIGIIYIGPHQKEELEVLSNKSGSASYQNFVNKIGKLYKLKQTPPQIYVGGLDVENNVDGEYTRYWQNKIIQIVFHIVTMMGGNNINLKKRHIGNNYVNIYFDESGQTFNFNIIKSQFNFLNIVITPHTFTTNEKVIQANQAPQTKFFKIKIYRRSGVPGVFSISHFKLLSEDNLPGYIRNLSIIADHFASVWHNVNYVGNWSQRVKQIKSIISKTKINHENLKQADKEEQSHSNTTQSFLQQLQEKATNYREEDSHMKYEYLNNLEDDDIYQYVEFNSYTN